MLDAEIKPIDQTGRSATSFPKALRHALASRVKADRAGVAFVFFVAFAVYIFCAYPALAPRDGADLLKSALTLYPAHPPGYPLYALSGHLWSKFLSLGNFAYRLNILSGLWGAGACALFFLWAQKRLDAFSAAALSLALAFSQALWKFSLLPEMYSAEAFFLAILLLISEGSLETRNRRAALCGLMAGLGLVNHQSLLLDLPAFAFMWIITDVTPAVRRRGSRLSEGLPLDSRLRSLSNKTGSNTSSLMLGRGNDGDELKLAALFSFLGLGLYTAMAIQLKSFSIAWGAITRSQYGTLELFSGLAKPLSPHLIFGLASYFIKNIFYSSSPALFLLALWGIFRSAYPSPLPSPTRGEGEILITEGLRTLEKKNTLALILGILFSGPLFLLLARFDPSNRIARSALEPSLIAPTFFLCALAAIGLSRLSSKNWRRFLALGILLWAFLIHSPTASHRKDFAAQDYIDDLLHLIPPGSAILARGDSAVFGLKYRAALRPSAPPRELYSDVDKNPAPWILSRASNKPSFVLGMVFPELASLGIYPGSSHLYPRALIQNLSPNGNSPENEKDYWDRLVLRPSPQLDNDDSYDYDIRRSFALAHYLSSGLDEEENPAMSRWNAEWTIAIDPEDYHLSQ